MVRGCGRRLGASLRKITAWFSSFRSRRRALGLQFGSRQPQPSTANPMLTLVIGNKNLSSWSLRPWLVLKHFGVPFQEVKLPLDTPEFQRDIVKYSPTRRVPLLIDGELKIWDSLA